MKEQELIKIILEKAKNGDYGACKDTLDLCRGMKDIKAAHNANKEMRQYVVQQIRDKRQVSKFFDLYRKSLLFDAPFDLDAYKLYLEIDRDPKDRFYQPRREVLLPVTKAVQALIEDELDELFVSMPPRVGKTTDLLYDTTWVIGKFPERTNLYTAFSSTITDAYYKGILEIINDDVTYKWHDVFPNCHIASTDGDKRQININRVKRYASITARAIDATLNGAVDCDFLLMADDLIGGYEEAVSMGRLDSKWGKTDNDLLTRGKGKSKYLWYGTRWSLYDPIGRRRVMLETNENFKNRRWKVITIPALNENDESNFNYKYGVGFTTEYFRQRRASFEANNDLASWNAQYMGEPIEREGTMFRPQDFRYYNGVLLDEPDRVFMAVDPAFGGGDYVAAPVCYQYGDDIYVPAVVYTNEDKTVSQPLLVATAIKYGVQAMQIEANKSLESYVDGIRDEFKKRNYKLNITSKAASTTQSKYFRILDKAPDIRDNMVFLESGKRTRDYELFMQSVFAMKQYMAKNQHDDAPDSLAMAIEMVRRNAPKFQIFKRTF